MNISRSYIHPLQVRSILRNFEGEKMAIITPMRMTSIIEDKMNPISENPRDVDFECCNEVALSFRSNGLINDGVFLGKLFMLII